jgi:hypothetical protein
MSLTIIRLAARTLNQALTSGYVHAADRPAGVLLTHGCKRRSPWWRLAEPDLRGRPRVERGAGVTFGEPLRRLLRINAVLQPDDSTGCEFSPPHGRARYPIRNPVSPPAPPEPSGQPCLALGVAAGAFFCRSVRNKIRGTKQDGLIIKKVIEDDRGRRSRLSKRQIQYCICRVLFDMTEHKFHRGERNSAAVSFVFNRSARTLFPQPKRSPTAP